MLLAAAAFALTIRVYDVYGLPPADRQVMLSVASTALAEAGVAAAIVDCSGPRPAAACQLPVAPNEVVLRIHRMSPDDSHALGVAFIHARPGPTPPSRTPSRRSTRRTSPTWRAGRGRR
jgi:hypothetical protein